MPSFLFFYLQDVTIYHLLLFTNPRSPAQKVDFIDDVKPILDKRCVSCHSCYNSPCQAKYSSFEGVDRGASKNLVYDATRLFADDPTRLFCRCPKTLKSGERKIFTL